MSNFFKKKNYITSSQLKNKTFLAHYNSIVPIKKNKIFQNKINNKEFLNNYDLFKNHCFNIKHKVFIKFNEFGQPIFLGCTHGFDNHNYGGFS